MENLLQTEEQAAWRKDTRVGKEQLDVWT